MPKSQVMSTVWPITKDNSDLLAFPSCVQKLSIYAYVCDDAESFIRFVEIFYTAWNRSLSIEMLDYLNDPLPVLSKVYEVGIATD